MLPRYEDCSMKAELLSPEEDPRAPSELAVDQQEELENHHTLMKSKEALLGR